MRFSVLTFCEMLKRIVSYESQQAKEIEWYRQPSVVQVVKGESVSKEGVKVVETADSSGKPSVCYSVTSSDGSSYLVREIPAKELSTEALKTKTVFVCECVAFFDEAICYHIIAACKFSDRATHGYQPQAEFATLARKGRPPKAKGALAGKPVAERQNKATKK